MKYGNSLFVSEALHKADIEFTEKGAKAAAVTVMSMGRSLNVPSRYRPIIIIFLSLLINHLCLL